MIARGGAPGRHGLQRVEGVVKVHDMHVWTIAEGYDALAAHVVVDPDYPGSRLELVLRRLRAIASRDFGIHHVTIQVEQSPDDCNEHHHADRLHPRERASEA